MIVPLLGLFLWPSPQVPAQAGAVVYVVSIVNENTETEFSMRFVLSGPPASYSATKEGDDIVVRIAAEALPGLRLPAATGPIRSLSLGPGPGFTLRITPEPDRVHEVLRDSSSVRLALRKRERREAPPESSASRPTPNVPDRAPVPSPSPETSPDRNPTSPSTDTADLYRRLFPSSTDPIVTSSAQPEIAGQENWYSNFRLFGVQAAPWISVNYVNGKTTQVESKSVTADSYWVVQPNIGFGFSPHLGSGSGQWRINYSPRFRRQIDLNLPRLTSHFFDGGIDQPVASFGSIYGTYHFSKGVLETDEIDPGREYGIGLNRVIDTSLERFKRNTLAFGVRFDLIADTQMDVNVGRTAVRYGNVPEDQPFLFGPRAFFDYNTRMLNASLRRGMGPSRFLNFLFSAHDTPAQKERKQIEGRGYTYGAALDGEIAVSTSGRLMFGYRTQKNPNAGPGDQDYKDITYGAQLVRELATDTTFGLAADRNLYLSAYAENGFYIADSLRGDLNTRLPFALSLRGGASLQSNSYKASPQVNGPSGPPILRRDRITTWSLGLGRTLTRWATLRVDYLAERRNSNLDRFDINTRALTFQLGVGFFGRSGGQAQPTW